MKNTAKKYLEGGLSILPVKLDKSPSVPKWKGVAFKPEDFLNSVGVGIRCGKDSGNLECLDFDNHFGDAKKTISEFVKQITGLYNKYNFPIQSTQSGGYHFLYRCETIEGNKKLASRPKRENKKWRPDAIIETRGEGGYFVAAPTQGYSVVRNDITAIPTITPQERKFIIEVCKSFNEWSEPVKVQEYETKERPGDYYNTQADAKADMINELRIAGWKQVSTTGWQRPGKKKGLSATLGKVADNVFYNFSANGQPFEQEAGYSPFQVVTLLKFKGNFSECAKWIKEKYKLNSVNDYHRPLSKPKAEPKTENELTNLMNDCFVDIHVKVNKPPVILEINHNEEPYHDWNRLITLGNFSAIIGKSKSKKTFFLKKLVAILGSNNTTQKFRSRLPENKQAVLHFDTEQSSYDVWKTANDIHKIHGEIPNLGTFMLRDKRPKERFEIIEHAVEYFKDNLGVLVIDGIADLVRSINSEDESNEILHKFMKWTEVYNIHIMNVIHQNKSNEYATGWLGSQILKKAELVMSVEKIKERPSMSKVKCDLIRGAKDFPEFMFYVDSDGLPQISTEEIINTETVNRF